MSTGTEARQLTDILHRLDHLEALSQSIYATGTWTPVLAGDTIAGTFTYGAETGADYTRHGNRVFVNGRIRITAVAVAPTGALRITGLPFAAASTSAIAGGLDLSLWHGITLTAGHTQLSLRILNTLTNAQFMESGSGVAAAGVVGGAFALIAGFADFQFTGAYQTA